MAAARPRRARNSMYAGWALLHAGDGMAAGSGWILATLPAAALVHRQVRREEQRLGADFGDEFERYQAAVPRYLGSRPFTGKVDRRARGGLRQSAGANIRSL